MSQQRTRASSKVVRIVTSCVHPDHPCWPCILCKHGNMSKYFHPKTWKDQSLMIRLQEYEPSLDIKPDSCICRKCRNNVSSIGKIGFIPRWRKVNIESSVLCYVSGCDESVCRVTKVADKTTICSVFGMPEPDEDDSSNGIPIILCQYHYGILYRHINPSHLNCKTCSKYILDSSKSRPVPEANILEPFLLKNTEFSGSFSATDRVCVTCYKSHLFVIKHIKGLIQSTDEELRLLLNSLKVKSQAPASNKTIEDAIFSVSNEIALHVGEALLKQSAVLLPVMHDKFKSELLEYTNKHNIAITQQDIPGSVWLRSQLSSKLEHHMAYKCSIKKIGTVLYRYGGDLFHALSLSLGEAKNQHTDITGVCTYLNGKCHASIKDLIQEDATSPHTIENLNIQQIINKIDPDIWKAICVLTSTKTASTSLAIRDIRRLFCVCAIFFSINNQCSFPMHTLLADIVETCGGSNRLVRLLNRLGICSSLETALRYRQYRVEKRMKEGILNAYPSTSFMIASADNLDYIHHYARVYCGKQQSSWHGTTVQIAQPKPNTLTNREVINEGSDTCYEQIHTLHINDKRLYSMRSPMKSISPCAKKLRRNRTGVTLTPQVTDSTAASSNFQCPISFESQNKLDITDFKLNKDETESLQKLKDIGNNYILLKLATVEEIDSVIDFQTYYTLSRNIVNVERSNVIYYKILNQRCDDNETLLSVINDLHSEFIVSKKQNIVLLEGDQATYERLQSLKAEYGSDLLWLCPFPGDWHVLKNFQEVLIKVYFEAGLTDLGKASGYNPTSISSNFKKTHHFLMETWESLYRFFMNLFLENSKERTPPDFLKIVLDRVKNLPQSETQGSALQHMLKELKEQYSIQEHFNKYLQELSTNSETACFWFDFVFQNCLAYIALYFAVRNGQWNLRMAAIKEMAAMFTAFDRPKYQKLIPMHIKDMANLPQSVLEHLQTGGFTVSLLGRPGHSIGVDEAHEMCINRECKEYVSHPSAENINRISLFLPIRAQAIKNLEKQIFPEREKESKFSRTLFTADPESKKLECNVRLQTSKLKSSNLVIGTSLSHLFNQKQITPQQVYDLKNFRQIGQEEYDHRVKYYILKHPSVKPPKHQKRLLTFAEKRVRAKKGSEVERERKLQIECWKKRVAYAASSGSQVTSTFEQCLELPRAIANADGTPNKGTKSTTTKVFQKRYKDAEPTIFLTALKPDWVPNTVIIEGMFLINITPWSAHTSMGDYADFLIRQHITPYFRNNATEVHLLFDDPNCLQISPKYFERLQRDSLAQVSDDHHCTDFSSDMVIPPKWRSNVLGCRTCKRKLVCFLTTYFLVAVQRRLRPGQKFVTGGGLDGDHQYKAFFVTSSSGPQSDESLYSNTEESDSRIWLHVINSAGTKKLVLSPDTDIYHIGLSIVAGTNIECFVRLSSFNSIEHQFLDMQALMSAFYNDPNLAAVDPNTIPLVMQMMFICTGCDFISFFNGFGKATFLATLFEYSGFICANNAYAPGILSDGDPTSQGFLSFLRLIGCAYFKKHKTVFHPSYPTPMTLFNSVSSTGLDSKTQHSEWLDQIREKIWLKVKYEEEMIPSHDALFRHWQRSCWVYNVWNQATSNIVYYPPLQTYGWKQPTPTTLEIDWDSDQNVSRIRHRVALIKKGCTCKTGCKSGRCKCKKNECTVDQGVNAKTVRTYPKCQEIV